MSEGLFIAAFVCGGIGFAHLDDMSPGHQRIGWVASTVAIVCLVLAVIAYMIDQEMDR